MIEPLRDLATGVIGFRFSGHVSKDEYRHVLLPALKERLDKGDKVRLAVVIDNDFDRFEGGALWEDMRFGFGSGLTHLSAWERMALVSDADWVRHAITLLGWLVPGEVKVFPLDQLDAAKEWLAG
jgi:SpoIIAA-like